MKSIAHRDGLFHNVFHCWIINGNKIWLQLRGKDKALFPNTLDISAAGHVQAGETPEEGGIREIQEEIGLEACKEDLIPVFMYVMAENYNTVRNREFAYNFFLKTEKSLKDLLMQEEEVDAMAEVTISDFIDLLEGDKKEIEASFVDRTSGGYQKIIGMKSMTPHDMSYYYTLSAALKEYLSK